MKIVVRVTLMAQFDVHRNSRKHKDSIPFVVVVQSAQFDVVRHPLEIVSIPVDQLGEVVGSLSDDSELIVAALDELLTRAWK